jgi:hypothetical protein
MTASQREHQHADFISMHVPFRFVRHGGQKEMQLPQGTPEPRRTDSTLVKALARAFRWKRLVEAGEFATFAELARNEEVNPSYVYRIVQLTLLPPDKVDEILEGRQGSDVSLDRVLELIQSR